MLSVNPASSGSSASSSTDTSNIAAFVSQNSIGILSTVPGSPTSVVAVRGNASLAVTWVAPANTGGSAITDYLVKYSSNGGAAWINFVHPVSIVPSLTVTGLTNGTAYVIKVIAVNAVGISLPSANSAPVTSATVPGSPTAVVAVSGNTSLAVTWTAPANTGGSVITDYLVKYSSNGGAAWTNFIHPVSIVPSLTVTGLTNGTAYVIKVIARNAIGTSLPSANSAPVTPATVPGSPTSVVAVSGNTQLAVTWTAPANTGGSAITDYLVKYSSNNGVAGSWTNFIHPVSIVPSLTVTGLTNGTAYVIKVIARNAIGISLPSVNSAPVTPAPSRAEATSSRILGLVGAPITEASGLAWSRTNATTWWTHNDSGDSARIFALDGSARIHAILPLSGAAAVDWEDIATGPGPTAGSAYLYVGDIGDNAAARASVRVYRVLEPDLTGVAVGTTLPAASIGSVVLQYPDGARDAESLLVDQVSGDLYIISKREAAVRVYRAPRPAFADETVTMEHIATLAHTWVVAADVSADNATVLVKTPTRVYAYVSDSGIAAAFAQAPTARLYTAEPQGEAIAANPSCTAYATLSEGSNQPLTIYEQ